ncbi:MAG: hypothetical protein HZB42_12370 [Sphingobacteriales bacterium]|nr:hypothetical protein [Sphingobacteriales bacterium]
MKKIFFIFFILIALSTGYVSAQNPFQTLRLDSARKVINNPNSSAEEKFYAYRSLNRYYRAAGLFDSSDLVQKELMRIAAKLNRDTLLTDAWSELGGRHAFRQEFNPALAGYFKALEYKPSGSRKARTFNVIAYLYVLTNNNELALKYLQKSDSVGSFPETNFQRNIFYVATYNALDKPDSALLYIQKAESTKPANPEPALYSVLLRQIARTYELKKDYHRADSCYNSAMDYCKKEKQMAGLALLAINYADFLLSRDSLTKALNIALETFAMARKYGFAERAAQSAGILKKAYNLRRMNDSAYFFSEMQIAYNDSVNNQKKIAEFQSIIFTQQLKEIEEKAKTARQEKQRLYNIQYTLLALGIVAFIFLFVLLARKIIIHVRVLTFLSVAALLIVFEFLNLLLHPFLENITNHSPLLMLLSLVCIAALLIPLHHRLQKWATHILIEKNKQIRLAATNKMSGPSVKNNS